MPPSPNGSREVGREEGHGSTLGHTRPAVFPSGRHGDGRAARLDNLSRTLGGSFSLPDADLGVVSWDIEGSVGAWLTPYIEGPTLGEADLDYPLAANWEAALDADSARVDLTLGRDTDVATPRLDVTGPTLGRAGIDLEVAYEQFQVSDVELAGFDVGSFSLGDSFEERVTLVEASLVPPEVRLLPGQPLTASVSIPLEQEVSFDRTLVPGLLETDLGGIRVELPANATATSSDFLPADEDDDPFGNVAATAAAPVLSGGPDLDGILSALVPAFPPLELSFPDGDGDGDGDDEDGSNFKLSVNLFDLELLGELGLGTRIEIDPSSVTTRIFDAAGQLLEEGALGDSFSLPTPGDAVSGAAKYFVDYVLDGDFVQQFVLVPSIQLPLKAGKFAAEVSRDLIVSELNFERSIGPLLDTDLLELVGIDASVDIPFFSLDPRPLGKVLPPEARTITREITVPLGDGPERTASTTVQDADGDTIGTLRLGLPTHAGDGDADYSLTVDTQARGTQFNFAFIIDRSGSMRGSKLDEAQAAFDDLIDFLEREGIAQASQFAVIPFNNGASLSAGLDADAARGLVNGISAGGGTQFGPPLAEADAFFSNAPPGATDIAYFLSDGMGSGASPSLQSRADVRAFGIGNADLDALDIIDTDSAVALDAPSDLADAFQTSGFDPDLIDEVELLRDGTVIETIEARAFTDTALGLTFDGVIDGLPTDAAAATRITARAVLDDGSVGGSVSLEITGGAGSGTPTDGADMLAMGRDDTAIDGGGGDDTITGSDGDDRLSGGAGNDVIDGGAGDDRIVGILGDDDQISGGPGIDTVAYGASFAETTVAYLGDLVRVGDNTDVLDTVEFIEFSDTRISTATRGPAPEIGLALPRIVESGSGRATATVELPLSEPFGREVTFGIDVLDGTATAGADFEAPAGALTLAPDATALEIDVPILADARVEGLETFSLEVTAPEGATFEDGRTVRRVDLSIEDADAGGAFFAFARPASVLEPEGDDPAGLAFEVVRTGATDRPASVGFAVFGAGAAPADTADLAGSALPSGRLEFAAGETVKSVTVDVVSDSVEEATPEGLGIRLSAPSAGSRIAAGTARAEIVETDAATRAAAPNISPVALDDRVRTDTGAAVTVDLLSNDTDLDGDPLTVARLGPVADGRLSDGGDGTVTYTPNAGFDGVDSFSYAVDDGRGGSDTATVTVTVVPRGDGLVAGTGGADRIDRAYWDDPEGDRIDGGDAIADGAGPDDDVALGLAGADTMLGGGGDDLLVGGAGADLAFGQAGGDTLRGGDGADTVGGGRGDDAVIGGLGDDALFGSAGEDALTGWTGADILRGGAGDDTAVGQAGADEIVGGTGDDRLFGGTGDDALTGWHGDDTLNGGTGDDTVAGSAGADEIRGGAGDDVLSGGAGGDIFVFGAGEGDDTVPDFRFGEDTIVILDDSLTFGDLAIENRDGDARVSVLDTTILLEGVSIYEITSPDVLFGAP